MRAEELAVLRDGRIERIVDLPTHPFVVGRGRDADLVLDEAGVSRSHVRLVPDPEGWNFEDAGSTNGVRLNGRTVQGGQLGRTDWLEVGPFRLQLLPPRAGGGLREPGAVEELFLATARIGSTGDPDALLASMLESAMRIFQAERGMVLLEGAEGRFEPAIVRSIDLGAEEGRTSQTVAGEAARRGVPLLIADSHGSGDFAHAPSIEASAARSILAAPMRQGDVVLGVVYLDGPAVRRVYTDRDLDLLSTFALHVAGAWRGRTEALRMEARAQGFSRLARSAARSEGKDPEGLAAASPAMRRLVEAVRAVARRDTTALLLGESGTGKELLARAIHDLSPRRDAPFVPVNCMALVADLAASELFGHERGAFTGAEAAREGRFELADGGTLFLDEVGELSLEMQVRLLRVLQERVVERVGSTRSRKIDVRVVAATNRDMKAAVREGRFREDLWYRLNVFPLEVPRLRDRPEDIPLLVEQFVAHFRVEFGRALEGPDPSTLELLVAYPWPGNVRELRNVIERAFVLEPGERITRASLPLEVRGPEDRVPVPGGELSLGGLPRDYHRAKDAFDLAFLKRALAAHGGNMTAAADEAGIPRKTIYRKLKGFGISVEDALREE